MIRLSNINIKGAGDWHRNGLVLRKRCEPYINILIIQRIRILRIAGLYLPDTELLFTGTQSFVLAAFATLVCQRNCVFLCKGTKLKIVMPVFGSTELWGPKPVIPDQRFCRLCNLGLSKKLRFSLQRHKS